MRRYAKYKLSGVEWIGEIPDGWEVELAKWLFKERNDRNHPDECLLASTQNRGVIPKEDMEYRTVIALKNFESFKLVDVNDFVISLRSFEGGFEYSRFRGIISPAYTVFTSIKSIDIHYFKHLFKSYPLLSIIKTLVRGIRDGQNINYTDFESLIFPLPPFPEQKAIADFLDEKTAKIDKLIDNKLKLIELLKEERTTIIDRAVTKGIDPNVKLKPSGVDWLGDMPEHWEIIRINRVIRVKDGTHDTPLYVNNDEGNFPLITSKDFENGKINFEEAKYISSYDHIQIYKRSNTETGDIIMSMIGGNIGNLVLVETDRIFSIKNVALFKTSQNKNDAKFLFYILKSDLLQKQIDLNTRGGAQGFLSLGDLRSLIYFIIPEEEKGRIIEHIETETSKIDTTISKVEKEIELLKEYRTALISEAVTGKIKVI